MAATAVVLFSGCGGGEGPADDRSAQTGELTVSAAASLTEAFAAYGESLPGEQRFSFAGSGALAAQIRQGAKPDLFAAADLSYPEQLAREGLVGKPVVFARNELVLAVPAGSEISSIADLTQPGLDLVICAEDVPCGSYTRDVLGRLPGPDREAVLSNVRSEEPDVKGVVGKLAQGAADAGFVYASDAAAAAADVVAIPLPARLGPEVAYGIAVVAAGEEPEAAQEFIDGLLAGSGRRALLESGFLPPPK